MRQVVGATLLFVLLCLVVYVLYVFVRIGIISPRKTAGARNRLRYPSPEGIETLTGFAPGDDLIDFYKRAPFVESREFYLVDRSTKPPLAWMIGRFSPLTSLDVAEELKIAGRIDGLPIAHDMEKGTYYVSRDGQVMLDTPNVRGRVIVVAPSISTFATFERCDWLSEDLIAGGTHEMSR